MTIHSRGELVELIDQGRTFEYLHFYSHKQNADGNISESCCSQWYPASFVVDQITYLTAEHFMMAGKARLFNDADTLEGILKCKTSREAKALGREVRNFERDLWRERCTEIVVAGNLAKFEQHPPLANWLKLTNPMILVEAAADDRVWGIGMADSDADAQDPRRWNGENLLGFALMQVRERLVQGK